MAAGISPYTPIEPDERVEPCFDCGGDGGWEVVDGPDHVRGGAITHWSECRACDGKGEVIVELEPVEADDEYFELGATA